VLAGVGHFPHVERPDAVANMIENFVETTHRVR